MSSSNYSIHTIETHFRSLNLTCVRDHLLSSYEIFGLHQIHRYGGLFPPCLNVHEWAAVNILTHARARVLHYQLNIPRVNGIEDSNIQRVMRTWVKRLDKGSPMLKKRDEEILELRKTHWQVIAAFAGVHTDNA